MRRDIDDALQGWPYDPEPNEVIARQVRARDGRMVLQVRIELGMLQMEVEGRPDGARPQGFATYLDFLRHRAGGREGASAAREKDKEKEKAKPWGMTREHRGEADREFVQFSHRRVAWLALQRYEQALRDADHTLALMDFVARYGDDADYVASHERFRGLVLFHRTQAAAAMALERRKPEEAIDVVRDGVERLAAFAQAEGEDAEADGGPSPNAHLQAQLRQLADEIRANFSVAKTLREQLDEAIAREDYERAARLRDQIRARGPR